MCVNAGGLVSAEANYHPGIGDGADMTVLMCVCVCVSAFLLIPARCVELHHRLCKVGHSAPLLL